MSFNSISFVLFSIIAIVLLRNLSPGRVRNGVLFVLNAIFLVSFISAPLQLLPLGCFLVLGYGAVCAAARKVRLSAIVIITVLLFIWLKHYDVVAYLPKLGFNYTTIGLSYILFRIIHLTVDVGQGGQKVPSPLGYLNYTLFFLNLVSGPIQRYEDFCASYDVKAPKLTIDSAEKALFRILLGYFMVTVVSSMASNVLGRVSSSLYTTFQGGSLPKTAVTYMISCVAYFIFMYSNFSGYMHIVIGIGRLAGYKLPENFNYPLKSKNVIDFWSRWHITLSDWFKFYLFNPLVMAMTRRWPQKQMRLSIGTVAFFATFFVMGMWHGSTLIYLAYGVWLGGLLSINYYWQKKYPKKFGKAAYKKLCENVWYRKFGWAAAMSYICIGMTCIWIAPGHAAEMVTPRGILIWGGAYFAFIALGTIAGVVYESAIVRIRAICATRHPMQSFSPFLLLAASFILVMAVAMAAGFTLSGIAHLKRFSSSYEILEMSCNVTFFAMMWLIAIGMFDPLISEVSGQMTGQNSRVIFRGSWMGIRLFVVAAFVIQMSSQVPQFIYQGF